MPRWLVTDPMLIVNGVRMKLLKPGDDLLVEITSSMKSQGIQFEDGDILALASKAVAIVQDRIVRLNSIRPSNEASELAKEYDLDAGYVELVLRESTEVYGGVWKALLTLKDRLLLANAGVDVKNAPRGHAVLLPKDAQETVEKIRRTVLLEYRKRIGVMIVDSHITPLRRGTVGLAIATAGIKPIRDYRSQRDLYGREIRVTTQALADELASAAHLMMGEAQERTPAVLIREAPVEVAEDNDETLAYMPPEQCVYGHILVKTRTQDSCSTRLLRRPEKE